MSGQSKLLEIDNLTVRIPLRDGDIVHAASDIDLTVNRGEDDFGDGCAWVPELCLGDGFGNVAQGALVVCFIDCGEEDFFRQCVSLGIVGDEPEENVCEGRYPQFTHLRAHGFVNFKAHRWRCPCRCSVRWGGETRRHR